MPRLRPSTSYFSTRPSIHEIAASILTPSPRCYARQLHHLPRAPTASFSPRTPQEHHLWSRFQSRQIHASTPQALSSPPPQTHDRGPASTEKTQTDFSVLDVLGGSPAPSTSIDACLWDGFHLNSGVKITEGAGVLLVAGEAFAWRPWEAGMQDTETKIKGGRLRGEEGMRLLNAKGQWEVREGAWGLLEVIWPKPDLLILGLGPSMAPLSPATRKFIHSLGIRVDIQDTRNASAQFNLLATERGVGNVAAALIPLGWREGVGVR